MGANCYAALCSCSVCVPFGFLLCFMLFLCSILILLIKTSWKFCAVLCALCVCWCSSNGQPSQRSNDGSAPNPMSRNNFYFLIVFFIKLERQRYINKIKILMCIHFVYLWASPPTVHLVIFKYLYDVSVKLSDE